MKRHEVQIFIPCFIFRPESSHSRESHSREEIACCGNLLRLPDPAGLQHADHGWMAGWYHHCITCQSLIHCIFFDIIQEYFQYGFVMPAPQSLISLLSSFSQPRGFLD